MNVWHKGCHPATASDRHSRKVLSQPIWTIPLSITQKPQQICQLPKQIPTHPHSRKGLEAAHLQLEVSLDHLRNRKDCSSARGSQRAAQQSLSLNTLQPVDSSLPRQLYAQTLQEGSGIADEEEALAVRRCQAPTL